LDRERLVAVLLALVIAFRDSKLKDYQRNASRKLFEVWLQSFLDKGRRMDVRVLFLCGETLSSRGTYASVEQLFGHVLPGRGYNHIWIAPSSQSHKAERVQLHGAEAWVFPKRRPTSLGQLLGGYFRTYRDIVSIISEVLRQYGAFDMVLVRDDPLMAWAAYRLKIPFVYQVSHFKEEEVLLYAKRGLQGSRIKNFLMGHVGLTLRNTLLRRADAVLPISEQMACSLEKYGIEREKMTVVPEGIDARIDPAKHSQRTEKLQTKLNLRGKQVLIYAGTMNRFRELDFLLRVLKALLIVKPEAHLLMVGDGPRPGDLLFLKQNAQSLGIDDAVTFTGLVARESVTAYILASEVGLSPFPPISVLINNSPIKILEYLNMARPVVASDIPAQREIIDQGGGGYCVPHEEKAFLEAVLKLLTDPVSARVMGQRGQRFVREQRDFQVLANIVEDVYGSVLNDHRC